MPARIFAIWIICYLGGAMIAPFFEINPIWWLIIGVVLCVSSFLLFRRKYFWAVIFGLGIIFLSVFQFQNRLIFYENANQQYAGKNIKFVASVADLPAQVEHGQKLLLEIKTANGQAQKGRLIIYVKNYPEVKFADTLEFKAKTKLYKEKENRLVKDRVIGEASVVKFEKIGRETGLKYRIKGILFGIRTRLNEALEQTLPQKEASLASGLILGEKSFISPEFKRALQDSGTSHIIALSGYNITIILSLFIIFQMRLSRRLNLILPLAFIIFFVIMTGASASIVRAGIMGFMPVLAKYLGRSSNSFMAILFSAFIMAVANPFIVLYDIGFQLSFAALCGMIYIGPMIARAFSSWPQSLNFILSETLGAQIVTLPLLLFYFGRVSIVAPISNLIILSLVPLGMLVSFLIGVFGVFLPFLTMVVAIPGYVLLHLFYVLISFFGSLPFASKQLEISNPAWLLMTYLIMLDLVLLGRRFMKREDKIRM
jgi:competence protein ComEC